MNQKYLFTLLEKYRNGTASEQEKAVLESWYLHMSKQTVDELEAEKLLDNLTIVASNLPLQYEKKTLQLRPFFLKVASVLLVCALGFYFYQINTKQDSLENVVNQTDFSANPMEATITLANGQQLRMSEVKKGSVTQEDNILIKKNAEGEVVYDATNVDRSAPSVNTLSTPRGGTYTIRLADGTKVTLNAASSLKYPTSFVGERRVELTGEAYFEVSHDTKNKFIVSARGQEVVVLGTQFNINSYAEEKTVKTTLLQGSVKITSLLNGNKASERILIPGDQAEIYNSGTIITTQVNTGDAIAWTMGKIIFDEETIGSVMRKVSLWYDVDVIYEGGTEKRKIAGTLSRGEDIKTLLDKIEFTGVVKFKIQGRRIVVMP